MTLFKMTESGNVIVFKQDVDDFVHWLMDTHLPEVGYEARVYIQKLNDQAIKVSVHLIAPMEESNEERDTE